MEQTESGMELTEEIIEHMMHPKNYGKLENPSGVGVGYDEESGEYVMIYLTAEGDDIAAITFATNGCQDTVILGSVFTEMVKGGPIDEARRAAAMLEEKIVEAPPKQQACSELVLTAFTAALVNREHRNEGSDQEFHKLRIAHTCDTDKGAE
jgi:nitrogen fixation protein NifU and related proteins